ncbi:MFS transporter [Streptomyces sp. NPDC052496]|uniref:MFS transporter n=1 Tax=Streptomyces sp. NPDC052496 TaxID=3154951 RepID=UPI0034281233
MKSAAALDTVPRRVTLAFLLVRGCSSAAYFTLLPFLGLWLLQTRGMSGAAGGTVVAGCLLFGRTGGLLVSRLVTALGLRRSVLVAYVTATSTLLAMLGYPGHSLPVWLLLAAVLGLSFSAATAALKALVAAAYSAEQRLRGFSHLNLAVNAGSALGSAAGGAVLTHWPGLLPLAGVVLYLGATISALLLPRPVARPTGAAPEVPGAGPTLRPFVVFLLVTSLTWVAYAQVFEVLPTYVADSLDPQQVSLLFVANAVLIIILQTPVTAVVQRLRARHPRMCALGLLPGAHLVMALSMVLFGALLGSPVSVGYAGILLFTLAEVVWGPMYDAEIEEVRGRLSSVTAYSAAGLAWGTAESAGTWLGMAVVTVTGLSWQVTAGMYWLSATGLVAVAGYFAVRSRGAMRTTEHARVDV